MVAEDWCPCHLKHGLMKPWRGVCPGHQVREGKTGAGQAWRMRVILAQTADFLSGDQRESTILRAAFHYSTGSSPAGIADIKEFFGEFGLFLKFLQLKPGGEVVSANLTLLHF